MQLVRGWRAVESESLRALVAQCGIWSDSERDAGEAERLRPAALDLTPAGRPSAVGLKEGCVWDAMYRKESLGFIQEP